MNSDIAAARTPAASAPSEESASIVRIEELVLSALESDPDICKKSAEQIIKHIRNKLPALQQTALSGAMMFPGQVKREMARFTKALTGLLKDPAFQSMCNRDPPYDNEERRTSHIKNKIIDALLDDAEMETLQKMGRKWHAHKASRRYSVGGRRRSRRRRRATRRRR
jgi:hypothetical protein